MYRIVGFEERADVREDLFNELCGSIKEAGNIANWKKWYPILVKYNAPVKGVRFNGPDGEGTDYEVSFEEFDDWVKTLPGDWPERFTSVMGSVTCCGTGFFLCDISETLYALEKGWGYRGGY